MRGAQTGAAREIDWHAVGQAAVDESQLAAVDDLSTGRKHNRHSGAGLDRGGDRHAVRFGRREVPRFSHVRVVTDDAECPNTVVQALECGALERCEPRRQDAHA